MNKGISILNLANAKYRSTRGFTLLELVIVLAIAAVLVAWGFPSLQTSIRNNQVSAQNAELISMFHFSKSEAVRRNTAVSVLLNTADGGWGAIVEDPAEEADVEGCVEGQLRCASHNTVEMTIDSLPGDEDGVLTFNNRGYIIDPDTPLLFQAAVIFLQHENCTGQSQRRRIDITPTGQINSCRLACDSTAECPL